MIVAVPLKSMVMPLRYDAPIRQVDVGLKSTPTFHPHLLSQSLARYVLATSAIRPLKKFVA